MLTPLSIISLDQGKIWKDPRGPLEEDADVEKPVKAVRGGQRPSLLVRWVAEAVLQKLRNRQA
jgi:hypothetical protein